MRHGNRVHVVERHTGFAECGAYRWDDAREMLTARDFRHHATKQAVYILRQNDQRLEHRTISGALDNRCRRFVA